MSNGRRGEGLRRLKSASPLEGEVGPQGRVGSNLSAFSMPSDVLNQYPPPAGQSAVDLPLKGGGDCNEAHWHESSVRRE